MSERSELLSGLNRKMLDHVFDDKCSTCMDAARETINLSDLNRYGPRRERSCPVGRKLLDQWEEVSGPRDWR